MKALIAAIIFGLGIGAATAASAPNGVTTLEEARYPNLPEWAQKAFSQDNGS